MTAKFVSPTQTRHAFSTAMSEIYQREVPLYSDLVSLVKTVNESFMENHPSIYEQMKATNQLERLHYERHGAIRLGTPDELSMMARFLAVMGMQPVGYYDLSQEPAKLPIHATCFRCLDLESLSINPFRIFVSLLRPELISHRLRSRTVEILGRRQIFSPRCIDLIGTAEYQGGLFDYQVHEFILEGLKTFKWNGTATVSLAEYQELHTENPLLADIVAFPGPHINHLTPRTLDIDAVQTQMEQLGIPAKDVIEGPPRRNCPILLRQTSFKALQETVYFHTRPKQSGSESSLSEGGHTARFGEIEQRGAALTRKGRALYDHLIDKVWKEKVTPSDQEAYEAIFKTFPDEWEELRANGLVYFRYFVKDSTHKAHSMKLGDLIGSGAIGYEALTYEDFLPLSAAGIFRSNLGTLETDSQLGAAGEPHSSTKGALDAALKTSILDEFTTYDKIQQESLEGCRKSFPGLLWDN